MKKNFDSDSQILILSDSMLILTYKGKTPKISHSAFIAPGAVIIGDVEIGDHASIWFGCIVRGDVNHIRIGAGTNIQDNSVVHVTRKTGPTIIGAGITIGHQVVIHAATLEDGCFIGMHSTILDGAVVESGGMIAAGAMVSPHKRIPKGQIWAGNPAKFLREMRQEEIDYIKTSEQRYIELAGEYRNKGT